MDECWSNPTMLSRVRRFARSIYDICAHIHLAPTFLANRIKESVKLRKPVHLPLGPLLDANAQTQSLLLQLPLELQWQIYPHVIASSTTGESIQDSLSAWDSLILCCRRARQEMGSISSQTIVCIVNERWLECFPKQLFRISIARDNEGFLNLDIGVPAQLVETADLNETFSLLVRISPLFRISCNTLTLDIFVDQVSLPSDCSPCSIFLAFNKGISYTIYGCFPESLADQRPRSRTRLNCDQVVFRMRESLWQQGFDAHGNRQIFLMRLMATPVPPIY